MRKEVMLLHWILIALGIIILAFFLHNLLSKLNDKKNKTKRDHKWIAILGVALLIIGTVFAIFLQKGIESFEPDKIPTIGTNTKVDEAVEELSSAGALIIGDGEETGKTEYTFVAGMSNVMIRNKSQEKVWTDNTMADLDDELQIKVTYRNETDVTAHDVQIIPVFLNDNYHLIPNTIVLYNSNNKNGLHLSTVDISNGVNIGDYSSGASAVITFDLKIIDNSLGLGVNVLRPWIQIYDDEHRYWSQDSSDIFVYKMEDGVAEISIKDGKIVVEQ